MSIFRYYPSNNNQVDKKLDNKIILYSFLQTLFFIFILWSVKLIEIILDIQLYHYGLYPRHIKGLVGILLSPLLHSDFNHLISNTVPLLVLLFALLYYYRHVSYQIFILLYLLSGIGLWFFGRQTWHIGASGLVYALATFHFFSGVIKNDVRLLIISLVIVFLYGGLVWGMIPINPSISWDGHIAGALSGLVVAFIYRKYQLPREKFDWEDLPDEEVENEEFSDDNEQAL